MKVKRSTLLLIACLVWSAAGFNILRIGVLAYPGYVTVVNALLSAAVFVVFQLGVFRRLVIKHTARISGYREERQFFLKFFDSRTHARPGCCRQRRTRGPAANPGVPVLR